MEGGGGDGPDSGSKSNADSGGYGGGYSASDFGFSQSDFSGVSDSAPLADQYQAYGEGRAIAETLAAPMRDTPEAMAPATANATKTFNSFTTGLLSLLGLASGSPAGVIGGVKGLAGLWGEPSTANTSKAHDLGVSAQHQNSGYASTGQASNGNGRVGGSASPAYRATLPPTGSTNTGLKLFPALSNWSAPGASTLQPTTSAPHSNQYLPIGTTSTNPTSTASGIIPAVMLALGLFALTG